MEFYLNFHMRHHEVIKHRDSFTSHFPHFIFFSHFLSVAFPSLSLFWASSNSRGKRPFLLSYPFVRTNVCASACPSASLTGRIILKFSIGKLYEKSVDTIIICLQSRKKYRALCDKTQGSCIVASDITSS